MDDTKQWYQSTSILGSIVTVIALFASIFNYTIDTEAQAQIVSIIIAVFGLAGSIYAIVGRVKATKVISSKPAVVEPPITLTEGSTPPLEPSTPVVEGIAPVMPIVSSDPLLQPVFDSAIVAYNQVLTDSAQVLVTQTK
jgi:hypothetical protein